MRTSSATIESSLHETELLDVQEYAIDFPKCLRATHQASRKQAPIPARVPRIARLMALAIHCDRLIRDGVVRDYAHLARIGFVTRARATQIMNLLFLAPDIQDELLHLPAVSEGADPITERHLRPLVPLADWNKQRRLWKALLARERRGRQLRRRL